MCSCPAKSRKKQELPANVTKTIRVHLLPNTRKHLSSAYVEDVVVEAPLAKGDSFVRPKSKTPKTGCVATCPTCWVTFWMLRFIYFTSLWYPTNLRRKQCFGSNLPNIWLPVAWLGLGLSPEQITRLVRPGRNRPMQKSRCVASYYNINFHIFCFGIEFLRGPGCPAAAVYNSRSSSNVVVVDDEKFVGWTLIQGKWKNEHLVKGDTLFCVRTGSMPLSN